MYKCCISNKSFFLLYFFLNVRPILLTCASYFKFGESEKENFSAVRCNDKEQILNVSLQYSAKTAENSEFSSTACCSPPSKEIMHRYGRMHYTRV